MKRKTKRATRTTTLHKTRFRGEDAKYRSARDKLLKAEIALRAQVEDVASMRRDLALGGAVPEDYVFDEGRRRVRLSELFADGEDTLVIYNYMYGPAMTAPCPMCTSILDSLDGAAPHVTQRVNLAVLKA